MTDKLIDWFLFTTAVLVAVPTTIMLVVGVWSIFFEVML